MKRKEKAAVDEFVALVGGKTWEPVRHKCMGKWEWYDRLRFCHRRTDNALCFQ